MHLDASVHARLVARIPGNALRIVAAIRSWRSQLLAGLVEIGIDECVRGVSVRDHIGLARVFDRPRVRRWRSRVDHLASVARLVTGIACEAHRSRRSRTTHDKDQESPEQPHVSAD